MHVACRGRMKEDKSGVHRMNVREWLNKEFTDKRMEKLAKCLVLLFVMVLSIFVLSVKVPETSLFQETKALGIFCGILAAAIIGILIWGMNATTTVFSETYNDGVEQIDINTIYLENSGVEVDFSEVLLSNQEETRKLIVSTQEAAVSTELSDKLIQKLDFDFLKKTQKVSYTGTGYFVVDLDNLTKESIVQDKENKVITIKIGHAYLQAIEIDPDKIIVDEVKKGLLAWGDLELTVNDYNAIEKELRNRLEAKFNTAENGQEADKTALRMVKEVYVPIVKAIDKDYSVAVEFK